MKVAILTTDSREHFKDYHTPMPYFGTAPEALLQGLAQTPEVEVHIVSCLHERVEPEAELAPNIFYHSLRIPNWGWVRTGYEGCVQAVNRALRAIGPDLVHGQGTERECAYNAVRSGYPNVITIHGNMRKVAKALKAPMFSFHRFAALLEGWTIRRTGGVVCLTSYTLRQVEDGARRTWILPNAVNESYFQLSWAPGPIKSILCVANIAPYKNQNFLIRALDPVAAAHGIRLVFLGNGYAGDPYFQEFRALVKERPWVVHEGFKKGDELKEHLRSTSLMMLPSLEDNCPMVLLEAMAVGAPVAAARVGGIPDLVEDGVTGMLFDPTDAEGMRAAALKIVNDPAKAQAVGAAGKKRALERHHPIQIARGHLAIYRDVLAKTSS